jgi:hypothetical protein
MGGVSFRHVSVLHRRQFAGGVINARQLMTGLTEFADAEGQRAVLLPNGDQTQACLLAQERKELRVSRTDKGEAR